MEYKQLGKCNLQISKIGFGCMSFKGDYSLLPALINTSIEYGINYFDTADIYDNGQNEIEAGKALKAFRKQVFIATKGGNQPKADGPGWNWNPTKAYIIKACEGSLRRLNTDYIDLYQLHGGTINDPIDELIEAFELLQQQGKIKYYGISSIRPNVIREYIKRSSIVSVMMQYNLLDRRPEETCFSLLEQNNIGVMARGSVAGGLLANKPSAEYLGYTASEVEAMADTVRKLSGQHRTKAQTAIQFVLSQNAVTTAVVGIRTLQQLNEAVTTFSAQQLTSQEIQQLKTVLPVHMYTEHR